MAGKGKTHYEVLEIRDDAELIDIKKAYRRLALRSVPVHCSHGSSTSTTAGAGVCSAMVVGMG